MVTTLLKMDIFPALSFALTENEQEVNGANPVTLNDVVAVVFISVAPLQTSYAVTPTLSVAPDQDSAVDDDVVDDAVNVGGDGGVTSGVSVVTFKTLLFADTFPAASFALTKKVYDVEGVSPVTEQVVLVVFAKKLPFLYTS